MEAVILSPFFYVSPQLTPIDICLIRFLVLLVAVQTRPVSSRPVIYIVPR